MPEVAVFVLFLAVIVATSAFHEPWYDEAQAWQIAKCADIADMLIGIPHYEGHPPLWWLFLAPVARSGIPFETGLKAVGLAVSCLSAWLIIFRSTFPRPVRLMLPFNYFVFYQYGVIVRPYGLMLLLMLALAVVFPERDRRPWPFVGVLCLLCLLHAYGMLMACGVALAWSWDIVAEKGARRFARELIRDGRTRSLLALLVVGTCCAASVVPLPDTFDPSTLVTNGLAERILYASFVMPLECLCISTSWFANDRADLQTAAMPMPELLSFCVLGLFLCLALWALSNGRNLKYYALPYLLFAGFGAARHLAAHHVGVSLALLVFWLWTAWEDPCRLEGWRRMADALRATPAQARGVRIAACAALAVCLAVPVWWTAASALREAESPYGHARDLAAFLKDEGLVEATAFDAWEVGSERGGSDLEVNTRMFTEFSSLYAYLGEGYFSNVGDDFMGYHLATEEENEANRVAWRGMGLPDVLVDDVDLDWVFGREGLKDAYTLVYLAESDHVWKGTDNRVWLPVYLRDGLLKEYGLEPLELTPELERILSGEVIVTSETMEALRSGEVSLGEYLDGLGL